MRNRNHSVKRSSHKSEYQSCLLLPKQQKKRKEFLEICVIHGEKIWGSGKEKEQIHRGIGESYFIRTEYKLANLSETFGSTPGANESS